MHPHHRDYDFSQPLDDLWEAIPEGEWSFDMRPGCAHLANAGDGRAEIFLRPCFLYGDTLEYRFVPGTRRSGVFLFGLLSGFEFITCELDFSSGKLTVSTHESHKPQPRLVVQAPAAFHSLKLEHLRDSLPGLPYSGSKVALLFDGQPAGTVGEIDFLPESLCTFGLSGRGEVSLAGVSLYGPCRPRPEYLSVGIWQQSHPTTAQCVDGLLEGVRQAAAAGVEMLVTPETSLTGLRPSDPELNDRAFIAQAVRRFQEGIAKIPGAPFTVVGYPDWIDGSEVEGATLDQVKVNSHRFVRPDGTLGPRMAKVHTCEEGLWHGRQYNLQRVCGAEVALGVCHDGRYADVWTTGVMAGARLCLHPLDGGKPRGSIPELLSSMRAIGSPFDAFWARVNGPGGSAILYPNPNRLHPETILATPRDLTPESETYPDYSPGNNQLAHARIRMWDATGCYPLRTLRSGANHYRLWSELMPEIVEV